MFSVSGRMSTNFRRRAAQHEGVGSRDERERRQDDFVARPESHSSAAISSADVHDVVSSTRAAPKRCSISCWHSRVNGPSPAVLAAGEAARDELGLVAARNGLLNGMR